MTGSPPSGLPCRGHDRHSCARRAYSPLMRRCVSGRRSGRSASLLSTTDPGSPQGIPPTRRSRSRQPRREVSRRWRRPRQGRAPAHPPVRRNGRSLRFCSVQRCQRADDGARLPDGVLRRRLRRRVGRAEGKSLRCIDAMLNLILKLARDLRPANLDQPNTSGLEKRTVCSIKWIISFGSQVDRPPPAGPSYLPEIDANVLNGQRRCLREAQGFAHLPGECISNSSNWFAARAPATCSSIDVRHPFGRWPLPGWLECGCQISGGHHLGLLDDRGVALGIGAKRRFQKCLAGFPADVDHQRELIARHAGLRGHQVETHSSQLMGTGFPA